MLVSAQELALTERALITQFTTPKLGIKIHLEGDLSNALDDVLVTMVNDNSEQVFSRTADHADLGTYDITLSTKETADVGLYLLYWDYIDANGVEQAEETYLEISPTAPAYDVLTDEFKGLIEGVYAKFADLFDSPLGGPHLQVYLQTNFGRQRMAQLLVQSLQRINAYAQPHSSYSVDGSFGKVFPVNQWGGFLEEALYIEIIKHLRRSYVEQPLANGVNVTYMDRRDYMDRWGQILQDEMSEYEAMRTRFITAHLGFGAPSVLVAGGAYPNNFGKVALPVSVAARPYYWGRYL